MDHEIFHLIQEQEDVAGTKNPRTEGGADVKWEINCVGMHKIDFYSWMWRVALRIVWNDSTRQGREAYYTRIFDSRDSTSKRELKSAGVKGKHRLRIKTGMGGSWWHDIVQYKEQQSRISFNHN